MLISELIKHLGKLKEEHGDLPCFTNGELGFKDMKLVDEDLVCAGEAEILMYDFNDFKATMDQLFGMKVPDDMKCVYIGGC